MKQKFLVVALTEDGITFERPEICTLDELVERHKAASRATDGNWSWVILSRVNVEVADAEMQREAA